jgi:cell division protease FtsH
MANRKWMRGGVLYMVIIAAILIVFLTITSGMGSSQEISFTEVVSKAKAGELKSLEVDGGNILAVTTSGASFNSRVGSGIDLLEVLRDEGINTGPNGLEVNFKKAGGLNFGILLNFLPLIFFGGLIIFMMRQAQGNSNQTMNFGKSKAKMIVTDRPTVTFDDVAGADEAKEELQEVVEFLKFPERFLALGARIPRGVLLIGPPGTGKTLLARAIAGEAAVPFFPISGSEFVEMFVGVGAARVRDLFDQAQRNAPCIIFVDEIDAVGRHRGAGLGGGHDEREQTLNQILVQMDGFETGTNVIVLAATNRPDILDPALLRPGRFDRRVMLDAPDVRGREAILKVHSQGKPLAPSVDLAVIAKQTPGFSGADLANLVNESALLTARVNKKLIGKTEFEEAVDRVMAGPERKSRVVSKREKTITAYHEAGHAVVAWKLPHADMVHKISIIARGGMGGYTRLLPEEERNLYSKNQFEDMLATALGGRVAEQVVFEEITTGASNDLERATRISLMMVKQYGMSSNLGPRTLGKRQELIFLGRELHEERDYSDKLAEEIDGEVQNFILTAYKKAQIIIEDNRDILNSVAEYLIINESVEGQPLEDLMEGRVPQPVLAKTKARPRKKVIRTRVAPKTRQRDASRPVMDGGTASDS